MHLSERVHGPWLERALDHDKACITFFGQVSSHLEHAGNVEFTIACRVGRNTDNDSVRQQDFIPIPPAIDVISEQWKCFEKVAKAAPPTDPSPMTPMVV